MRSTASVSFSALLFSIALPGLALPDHEKPCISESSSEQSFANAIDNNGIVCLKMKKRKNDFDGETIFLINKNQVHCLEEVNINKRIIPGNFVYWHLEGMQESEVDFDRTIDYYFDRCHQYLSHR